MQDIVLFPDETIAGLITQSILMILLPIVLLIIWKKKTKEKLLPVVFGALSWLLFAIVLKLVPTFFLLKDKNPVAETISGNIWYTMILAGILAGVFEETGRFITFKTVLKNREERRVSISYGIGHGGFESIYIAVQFFSLAAIMLMINNGMTAEITAGADEATTAELFSQLGVYTQYTFVDYLLGVFERIFSIAAHIAFSVFVFAAARDKKRFYLYPLSIFLHALFDFSTVFYQAEMIPLPAMELILAAFSAVIVFFAARLYKKLAV